VGGGLVDYAVFEIDKVARFNTMCAVANDLSTTPFTVTEVTGTSALAVATPFVNQAVWKYGFRTHKTTGSVFGILGSALNSPIVFLVSSTTHPAFDDGNPQKQRGKYGGTAVPDQIVPENEKTFWEQQIRGGNDAGDMADIIANMRDPGSSSGATYGFLSAADIIDKLWENDLVKGYFGTHGDSGSLVLKVDGGSETGLVQALLFGGITVTPSTCGTGKGVGTTYRGTKWCTFEDQTAVMDIDGILKAINEKLVATGNPTRVSVCKESVRKTQATATDCTKVKPVSGKCAAWMCKPSADGTSCESTGVVGLS